MAKYYVYGNGKTLVINRPTAKQAAMAFLVKYGEKGNMPPQALCVNESGDFSSINTNEVFNVDSLLGEIYK